jgi:hypothetical protein
MELLDLRAQSSEHEMQRLENEVQRISLPGHQSEPTTPPEYRDNGFPSAIARPNRLSLASLSALTSPQKTNSFVPSHRNTLSASHHGVAPFAPQPSQTPSDSVPTSRRNSDEEDNKLSEADIAKAARRSAV